VHFRCYEKELLVNKIELDNIIKNIMDNLSNLKKEDADGIVDVVDMAKEELSKPEPKSSRLKMSS
jgi:hypothetical protein